MKFLPYDKFSLVTTKTKEEIMLELAYNTNEGTLFSFFGMGKGFFNGHLHDNSFKIAKRIFGRNSFLPILIGEIEDMGDFRKVNILARPIYFTVVFMGLWVGGFTLATLIQLYYNMTRGTDISSIQMTGLFAVFGYAMTMAGFYIPLDSCKKKLEEIICS